MNLDRVADPEPGSSVPRWKLDRWGLVRGLAILLSAFLGVSILYFIIATVSRG